MQQLILVVDGDQRIRRYLSSEMEAEGYRVSLADKGQTALECLEAERPDLVVLDFDLPGLDGLSVLRQIRQRSQVPVVMLTREGNRRERIAALDLGADDYVAKPLDVDEFLARVRALLRRSQMAGHPAHSGIIDLGGLRIDLDRHRLLLEGREVSLCRIEWLLLAQLAANLDRVTSHRELLTKVWGPEFSHDVQYLRTWVCQLRHKMGDHTDSPRYLLTVSGVGYRLQRDPTAIPAGHFPSCQECLSANGRAAPGEDHPCAVSRAARTDGASRPPLAAVAARN